MADADSIIGAIGNDALEGIQRVSVAGESVDMMSVEDRLKAAEAAAAAVAVTKPHLGMFNRQIIPPGCG